MAIFRKVLGGSILIAAAGVAHGATDYPSGYTKCAKEGATCSFTGSRSVAYGKSGTFVYATLTGPITCQASLFPSISVDNPRYCSYAGSASPPPTTPPPTTPPPTTPPPTTPPPTGSITGSTCGTGGASVTVSATIVIASGQTVDGGCRVYNATSALGDGSQSEGQSPAFRINGGTLRNAVLGNNGVDGVHFYGGGTLTNFRWNDIGEDAFTIKSTGTVNISGITASNGADKFAQVNAAATLNISNCILTTAGKFLRQNGGTSFAITVNADRCRISNMSEGIFRTDSSTSTARLTNSQLHSTGTMCIGPWRSCTGSGNTTF